MADPDYLHIPIIFPFNPHDTPNAVPLSVGLSCIKVISPFLMVKPGCYSPLHKDLPCIPEPMDPQVALALPLATLLDQALPGVAVGAVSGVSSMTEERRDVARTSGEDTGKNMGKTMGKNYGKT